MNTRSRRIVVALALLLICTRAFAQIASLALSGKADSLVLEVEGISAEIGLAAGDLLRITAIGIRNALLPYIYSTAWQVWSEGLPMMRPLFFLDPTDPRLTSEDSSYLFGDWLLVCPVTKPLSAAPTKKVYLPTGCWYDINTMTRYEGGGEVDVQLSLEKLPVFIREGAILPTFQENRELYTLLPGPVPTRYTVFRLSIYPLLRNPDLWSDRSRATLLCLATCFRPSFSLSPRCYHVLLSLFLPNSPC